MKKTNLFKVLAISLGLFVASCSSDSPSPSVCTVSPTVDAYTFNGSFTGQTLRLLQGNEIYGVLNGGIATAAELDSMFSAGNSFTNAAANGSKNIRSKIGYGTAEGLGNATDAALAQADFDAWLADYANNVVPFLANTADNLGNAGTLDGYQ